MHAKAGEVVTCEGGHAIATLACDLTDEVPVISLKNFKDWQTGFVPAPSSRVITRCKCGAEWLRIGNMNIVGLHFSDGWRT